MRKNVFLLYKEPKEQQYEIKHLLKPPYFSPLSCKSVCPNFLAVLFPVIPAEAGIQLGRVKVDPRLRGDDRRAGESRAEARPTGYLSG